MSTWLDAVAIWTATGRDRTMPSYKGESTMNRLIALFLIAGATLLATGCNTVAGAGQDISKGGNAITNSADKASQYRQRCCLRCVWQRGVRRNRKKSGDALSSAAACRSSCARYDFTRFIPKRV
jgi:entericidin B